MRTTHVIALIASIRDKAHRYLLEELAARGIEDLAPSHGAILSTLYERGPLSMQELARRIERDKSTATALVKKLLKAGYVEQGSDPADGRRIIVRLSRRGRALRPSFDEISRKLVARAFRGFERGEKEGLVRGLERMLGNW